MGAGPIPLRQVFTADEIAGLELVPGPVALGPFWVDSKDPQSRAAKFLKNPSPPFPHNRLAQALAESYADLLAERISDWKPDFVLRVLASRETKPDHSTPMSALTEMLARRLQVPVVEPFFRTDSRKSMRYVPRLSGPDALKLRVHYALQDLCVFPQPIPGKAVLLDDIYNLGASARVYAAALKRFCRTEAALSVNVAATRFNRGKDGWGRLKLDIERLMDLTSQRLPEQERSPVDMVVLSGGSLHLPGCLEAEGGQVYPRFLCPEGPAPCPLCMGKSQQKPWWKRLLGS